MYVFSVIIPTYNRADRLRIALDSLVTQTYTDFEVIVCDDGSTDSTGEVVEKYKDRLALSYIREDNWGGPARPRNNGIKAAQGEWICFLDSDDWWYPNKLEVVYKYTDNFDVLYHDLDIEKARPSGLLSFFHRKTKARKFSVPIFRDMMLNDSGIPNSSAVVRKSLILAVGGLTEDKALIAVEDLDLWLKLARKTDRFMYIPESLGRYWVDGANISEVSEKQINRYFALYDQHFAFLGLPDQKQAYALLCYNVGRVKLKNGQSSQAREYLYKAFKTQSRLLKFKVIISLISSYVRSN